MLNGYQALTREIASPTLPAFVTACLQIVKPPASSKASPSPLRLVEAVANALCTVTPLYPTTLRPFSAQIKAAFRTYVAPTQADGLVAPQTLRQASRTLFVLQHYTTPKNGNTEEWAKTIGSFIKGAHNTGDHVFRAVQESWESSSNYTRQNVSYDEEAHGGGDTADELPAWTGVSQGAERLIGVIETIGEFFKCSTKCPVVAPVSQILDLTSRITMILPPRGASRLQDDIQLNSAIGREEKDELWSVLPEIHVAVIDLLISLVQRLQENAVSIAADILHQTVRIFDAEHHAPLIRERAYVLFKALLLLHGPTMPKISVNSLDRAIQSCCRDLLSASGHVGPKPQPQKQDSKPQASSKPSASKPSTNADAYLTTQSKSAASAAAVAAAGLSTSHIDAASALLPLFLSHLPQEHLKQTLRALIDRTAVLSHNKDAMVSSVLNPYRTRTGKTLASLLPFLVRDFPRDQSVEVFRSNLRAGAATTAVEDGDDDKNLLDKMQADSQDEEGMDEEAVDGDEKKAGADGQDDEMQDAAEEDIPQAGFDLSSIQAPVRESLVVETEASRSVGSGASVVQTKETVMLSATLKRKSEELEEPPAKRLDTGKVSEVVGTRMDVDADADEGSDSDSDLDVQLNATLEDDDSSEDGEDS